MLVSQEFIPGSTSSKEIFVTAQAVWPGTFLLVL